MAATGRPYEISLSLRGDQIDALAFVGAVRDFLKLLAAVDQGLYRRRSVRWQLSRLQYASPAVVAFVGLPRSRRIAPDVPELVGRTAVAGIGLLEQGERPANFPDEALEAAKELAELKGERGIVAVAVTAVDGAAPLTLSRRTAAAVDDFIGPRFESYGAIEGQLEVISAHGGLSCNIYEPVFGKPVKCHVPAELKADVLRAFESRVVGRGLIRRDSSGQARTLKLESLEVVAVPGKLPQSLAGIAPDITDGEDVADWLKKRWQ